MELLAANDVRPPAVVQLAEPILPRLLDGDDVVPEVVHDVLEASGAPSRIPGHHEQPADGLKPPQAVPLAGALDLLALALRLLPVSRWWLARLAEIVVPEDWH